jgi:hypothetical protein
VTCSERLLDEGLPGPTGGTKNDELHGRILPTYSSRPWVI